MVLVDRKRSGWNWLVRIALIGLSSVCFMSCSTAKLAPKAQEQAEQPKAPPDTKRLVKAPVSESSSLEQLQQGEPLGTSPSSPLKDIYFDFDRYDLRADARETLKADAEWLKQNPVGSVQIEGHCDERGTAEYNLALGAKRAQTAKDYLTTLGIAAQRLSTISYGQELPVCTEHNEDCWQKNRHDRFVVKSSPTA